MATEHLQPEQFGKFTIAHDDTQYRQITARGPRGGVAGYLHWEKESPPGWPGRPPTILGVQVDEPHRGHGLASAMLQHALKYEPNLKHSHALTDDGKRFAKRNPL
jgi:GNAT superfamily N-acetyltransferase